MSPPSRPVALAVANVGLHVASLEESLEFYRDLLGMTVVVDSGWLAEPQLLDLTATPGGAIRIVNLRTDAVGGATITLVQVRGIERKPLPRGEFHDPGTMHLAVDVDDMDGALARLSAAGVTPIAASGEVSGGGAGRARVAFVRDPTGFFVELVHRLDT